MKTKRTTIAKQNRDILNVFIGTGVILMIPAVMMQISNEWDWKLSDFIIIGTILIGAGLTFVFTARKMPKHRVILGILFLLAVMLLWAELAVGVFGSPFAGN